MFSQMSGLKAEFNITLLLEIMAKNIITSDIYKGKSMI